MITDKGRTLQMLREEYYRWEELLSSMNEAQITNRQLPSGLSIKDVIAHLWSWQQISIARMEAGLDNREPELPEWLENLDPDSEENLETINARIHENNLERPWVSVYADWKEGFLHLVELGESMPEEELLDRERYSWLNGHSLDDVLIGSFDHHNREHFEPLSTWLRQNLNL